MVCTLYYIIHIFFSLTKLITYKALNASKRHCSELVDCWMSADCCDDASFFESFVKENGLWNKKIFAYYNSTLFVGNYYNGYYTKYFDPFNYNNNTHNNIWYNISYNTLYKNRPGIVHWFTLKMVHIYTHCMFILN